MPPVSTPSSTGREPFLVQLASFSWLYWIANWMELVERFAYYGVRVVLPTFMVATFAQGGPEFNHIQKGTIYAIWALVQSFVPIFTGGFADRYGYKANIALSTVLKIIGYMLMGYAIPIAEALCGMSLAEARPLGADRTYEIFFAGAMFLALGTAIFKPGLQGIIANQMPRKSAALGWALFYQMVNIGGFVGPAIAGALRVDDWTWVFLMCAAAISLNFIPLFLFREPEHKGSLSEKSFGQVFMDSARGLLEPRLFFFTLAFAGFWLMFYQLFDILPNFIDDWVDSRAVASALQAGLGGVAIAHVLAGVLAGVALLRFLSLRATGAAMKPMEIGLWLAAVAGCAVAGSLDTVLATSLSVPTINGGNLTQEWMINFNAFLISLFAFAIGYLTGRVRSLTAIIIGIGVSALAIYGLGLSMNGWLCLAMIGLFSFGEMSASPTKMRYLASIAPPGKEGSYMGYVNFTVGIGWSVGSILAGDLYQSGGDKRVLARQYLVEHAGIPKAEVAAVSQSDLLAFFEKTTGLDPWQTREVLWITYEPYSMWVIFTAIGVVSMIGILVYNLVTRAAAKRPQHPFNTHGHVWVRVALALVAGTFWWFTWERLVVAEKDPVDVLAVPVQAVLFSALFVLSLFTGAPEDALEVGAEHED